MPAHKVDTIVALQHLKHVISYSDKPALMEDN